MTLCARCGKPLDWRGADHHYIHKKMGGRKLKGDSYKVSASIPVRSETIEEVEASKRPLCGRCHDLEHGIKDR